MQNRKIDNSERTYDVDYVEEVRKGRKIKQLVDRKSYEGDQSDIKSISMKELRNNRWCIFSKNTYMKVTTLQGHELQELIIVSASSFAKYPEQKRVQKSQSNVGTSAQQKEPTEKTVKKDEEVKRKAAPLTNPPPAKKQKTISNKPSKEPETTTTTTATNVNHATNPYVFFWGDTQTVPRATSSLNKSTVTPIPVSKPVTIEQESAEEVMKLEDKPLGPRMKFV